MGHTYDYARPAATADCAVLDDSSGRRRILLIQRKHDPYAGKWALPGGFINENEHIEDAARRELKEETGLSVDHLTEVGAFGDPGRDPRGWTITVAFVGRASVGHTAAVGDDDANDARWFDVNDLPPLAFDHDKIIAKALQVIGKE